MEVKKFGFISWTIYKMVEHSKDPFENHGKAWKLNLLGFFIIHTYFALGMADGGITCLATADSDLRLEDSSSDQVKAEADDVGQDF